MLSLARMPRCACWPCSRNVQNRPTCLPMRRFERSCQFPCACMLTGCNRVAMNRHPAHGAESGCQPPAHPLQFTRLYNADAAMAAAAAPRPPAPAPATAVRSVGPHTAARPGMAAPMAARPVMPGGGAPVRAQPPVVGQVGAPPVAQAYAMPLHYRPPNVVPTHVMGGHLGMARPQFLQQGQMVFPSVMAKEERDKQREQERVRKEEEKERKRKEREEADRLRNEMIRRRDQEKEEAKARRLAQQQAEKERKAREKEAKREEAKRARAELIERKRAEKQQERQARAATGGGGKKRSAPGEADNGAAAGGNSTAAKRPRVAAQGARPPRRRRCSHAACGTHRNCKQQDLRPLTRRAAQGRRSAARRGSTSRRASTLVSIWTANTPPSTPLSCAIKLTTGGVAVCCPFAWLTAISLLWCTL
jgi:hypothetical protein